MKLRIEYLIPVEWFIVFNGKVEQFSDGYQSQTLTQQGKILMIDKVKQLVSEHPDWNLQDIADSLGISIEDVNYWLTEMVNSYKWKAPHH
jgi:hypothetical protein